jgi:hypothetical protein
MKKITIFIGSFILALTGCNKEASKSANTPPLEISVTDVSDLMQVSNMKLNSNETLDVQYTGLADSIVWWVTDSTHSVPVTIDSTILFHNPPHDSLPGHNPGDTLYTPPSIPVDSTHYPPDTTINIPPPYYDSAHNYHPADSSRKGDDLGNPFASAYTFTINKNHLTLKINLSGSYVVHVAVYQKNADGSFTLIKTGYVKLLAN